MQIFIFLCVALAAQAYSFRVQKLRLPKSAMLFRSHGKTSMKMLAVPQGVQKLSPFLVSNKAIILVAPWLIGVGALVYLKAAILSPSQTASDPLLRAVEEGRGFTKPVQSALHADRPQLEKELSVILQPSVSNNYFVIVGRNGTGKTTAVVQTLSISKGAKGAIYISCPPSARLFSFQLHKLIGCAAVESADTDSNHDLKNEPLATFEKLMSPLAAAAAAFRSKHGRPAVLVIDAVDRIAKQCPEFLGVLQDFAKDCADAGNLRVVFVADDSATLPLLMKRGAWARAAEPYKVQDLLDEQAVAYLLKRGVCKEEADSAVSGLTGGNFAHVDTFAEASLRGISYWDLSTARNELLRLKIRTLCKRMPRYSPEGPYDEVFKIIAYRGEISVAYADECGMTQWQLQELLKENILVLQPDQTYSFYDHHTAYWFRSQSGNRKKKGWNEDGTIISWWNHKPKY